MIKNEKELDEWFISAIGMIKSGIADKFEKGKVTVYKCGKIIRIDIKEE